MDPYITPMCGRELQRFGYHPRETLVHGEVYLRPLNVPIMGQAGLVIRLTHKVRQSEMSTITNITWRGQLYPTGRGSSAKMPGIFSPLIPTPDVFGYSVNGRHSLMTYL